MHSLKPAVAVMAKVPGATAVKSRLHPSLTAEQATELYRCFLLDRLDALTGLAQIAPAVAFTPPSARARMAELAPREFRLIAQRGADLGARLSNLLTGLLRDGHPGAIAIDSDSPTLPMDYVWTMWWRGRARSRKMPRTSFWGRATTVVTTSWGCGLPGPRSSKDPVEHGEVLRFTLEKARRLGLRLHLLPQWFDVDTESDLRRLHEQMVTAGAGPPRTLAFVRALYR